MKRKIPGSKVRRDRFIEAQQWVREYYDDDTWRKILLLSVPPREYYSRRPRVAGWQNYSTDVQGTTLGPILSPTRYTYQSSISIFGYNVSLNRLHRTSSKLVLSPYWWGAEPFSPAESFTGPVTREFVHRVLSTIPVDQRPYWLVWLHYQFKCLRSMIRRWFSLSNIKYRWRMFKRFRLHRWYIHRDSDFTSTISDYLGEDEYLVACLTGAIDYYKPTEYHESGARTEYLRFHYLGVDIDYEYHTPSDEDRGKYPYPYLNSSRNRTLVTLRGGGGLMYPGTLSKWRLRQILRTIERTWGLSQYD